MSIDRGGNCYCASFSGHVTGLVSHLMRIMSADITEKLGVVPGGEFRAAAQEAKGNSSTLIKLGDRPILITMKRAVNSMNLWTKLKFAYALISAQKPDITEEFVEEAKNSDMVTKMMEELEGSAELPRDDTKIFASNIINIRSPLLFLKASSLTSRELWCASETCTWPIPSWRRWRMFGATSRDLATRRWPIPPWSAWWATDIPRVSRNTGERSPKKTFGESRASPNRRGE